MQRDGPKMFTLVLPALDGTLTGFCSEEQHRTQLQAGSAAPARFTFRSKGGLEIQVVELSESRFEELVRMYEVFEPKRGAQGLPPAGRERIVAWLRNLQLHGHNLLAIADNCVIGHSMLCPVDDGRAEFAIFLDEGFRNQGIGTGLTKATLDYGRHLKFRGIWLSVETNNGCAIRVYRKTGFQLSALFGPEQEMALDFTEAGTPPGCAV
jgi:RimJ/RimL family protein N-acetyltransferase